jgi:phage terminase Nu1 subunit (DNA packaging protein)
MNFEALTQRECAAMHGVDARTVRRWDDEDGHPRNDDGTYCAKESITWRIHRETGAEHDLNAERARLAKEQADRIAMENAVRRGELADLNSVSKVWASAFSNFRARMLGAPNKLAPLVNPDNPNLARDIIAAEHERILSELAIADLCAGDDQ